MLILLINWNSHTGFRSVPKSVTLSDLERPSDRHFSLFHTKLCCFWSQLRQICCSYTNSVGAWHKCIRGIEWVHVVGDMRLMGDDTHCLCGGWASCFDWYNDAML